MDKEKKRFLRRRAAWLALRIFTAFNSKISLQSNYVLGSIAGKLFYNILSRHHKVARESLEIAYPQLLPKKREKIARDFFVFMAQSGLELLYCLKNPQQLKNISLEGENYLKESLTTKKGVIIVSAHLGNFPLMSLKLASLGYKVNVVVRPMRDEKAGTYIHYLREKAGVGTIYSYPRRACVSSIVAALRNNEIVIMQMDQNFGTSGVWVKFFNKLAATPTGPVTLSLRTGACILPGYIYRKKESCHRIVFHPPYELSLKENREQTILVNVISLTRIIENWVRLYPSQWGWIHRRWKSRPSEKIKETPFKIEKT